MKHVRLFAAALVILAIAGCGGSSDNNTPAPAVGPTSEPRVEAVLAVNSGGGVTNPSNVVQDPENIEEGETVYFELVNYTTTNGQLVRNVLPAGDWTSSDSTALYGNLAQDSGLFTAGHQETPAQSSLTASTFFEGKVYSAYWKVKPREVRLIGRVVAEGTDAPVMGVLIAFYAPKDPFDPGSAKVRLGGVRSSYDGTFRASVPPYEGLEFKIENSSLPDEFFRSFQYFGNRWDTGSDTCRAFVPADLLDIGTRYLYDRDADGNPVGDSTENGSIVLATKTLYPNGVPASDGCSG